MGCEDTRPNEAVLPAPAPSDRQESIGRLRTGLSQLAGDRTI